MFLRHLLFPCVLTVGLTCSPLAPVFVNPNRSIDVLRGLPLLFLLSLLIGLRVDLLCWVLPSCRVCAKLRSGLNCMLLLTRYIVQRPQGRQFEFGQTVWVLLQGFTTLCVAESS